MNYHFQNLLWALSSPFGRGREGNIISEVIRATGSQLRPDDYAVVECRFRLFRRMLSHEALRTMFIVKAKVSEKLQDLMIEIYRGYQQSRVESSVLFFRDSSFYPVCVIGRGDGYDFIHIVRSAEPGTAGNSRHAARSRFL